METMSKRCKYHGRGFEAQDSKVMMHEYMKWAYQLAPWIAFEDLVGRADKLRGKIEVAKFVEKLRCDERERYISHKFGSKEAMRQRTEDDSLDPGNAENPNGLASETRQPDEEFDEDYTPLDKETFPPAQDPPPPRRTSDVISPSMKEKIAENRRIALEKKQRRLEQKEEEKRTEAQRKTDDEIDTASDGVTGH